MTDCSSAFGLDFVSFHEPLEDLVLCEAALDFLEAPALLHLRIELSRVYSALLCLFRQPVVDVLLGRGELLPLGDCLDDKVAPDLSLGHVPKFRREPIA